MNSAAPNTLTTEPVAAPGQQQLLQAACCSYVIMLPELGSHGKLDLSGSLLVLKENFFMVPGIHLLFLHLNKQADRTLLGQR